MILTVTLNTSIDKRYLVEKMNAGQVNRVSSCRYSAGGKGLNVSRAAVIAGESVIATGFAGGHNGALLEELAEKDGIRTEFVHVGGETRSCINIMDAETGIQTEFLEAGEAVPQEKIAELEQRYRDLLAQAEVVTISGSTPKGMDDEIYVRLIQAARDCGIPVLLDTSGKLLQKSICARPALIKPNQDEIRQLTGKGELSEEELKETALYLRTKGITYVVVSLGKKGSLMAAPSGIYKTAVPKVEVKNTVGCGDSMLAGFAIGIKNRFEDEKLLRYASAIAAANAMQEKTGFFEKKDFEEIYEKIQITSIRNVAR
ncbi:1-phosphofructokinase [Clostridium sp. AF19-22AC]|uniref:1-phosphofructokinase n=1 Tax=Clostridia TaxID=186801 RepID=UPI000E539A7A|nr:MULTISPECIES: 1-phosphofructokinase [Clostridia]RHR27591.1 1-phosphofructokinase [Clostridium sp. AF19-22AC]